VTTLQVRDLVKNFTIGSASGRTTLTAVDKVSFTLRSGETVALVGESGSGKSTIARILARLTSPSGGEITLDGQPLGTGRRAVRRYRSEVQMVFQDPFSSLNPLHSVRYHLRRPLQVHGLARDRASQDRGVAELLSRVNLGPAETIAARYPHELSGGQRQRIAIARALAPRPRVLLADEPVSMLDVSIRLEILNLIDELKRAEDLAVLYITHDLATARHFASTIMVMYKGEIVESGPADDVILRPAHPYTRLLASAAPDPRNRLRRDAAVSSVPAIPVTPAGRQAADSHSGCRFRVRCPLATDVCARRPPDFHTAPDRLVRCWNHAQHEADDTGSGR
jgi:peptide/nickel transport system ATP-binding protein